MKKVKNNLDEMQEQKLLHIEHNGCWIAFWGLVFSILVQQLLGKGEFKNIAGECIILIILSIYMTAGCVKNGIWDRKLKADNKTNFIASLIGGLVVGGIWFIISYRNYHKFGGSVAVGVFMLILTFVLCFIMISILSAIYKKRKDKLENQDEE